VCLVEKQARKAESRTKREAAKANREHEERVKETRKHPTLNHLKRSPRKRGRLE